MSAEFKKGDVVRCVEPLIWKNIKKGGYYEVVKISEYSDEVEVINNVNDICGYSKDLFIPAEISIGDYVGGTLPTQGRLPRILHLMEITLRE